MSPVQSMEKEGRKLAKAEVSVGSKVLIYAMALLSGLAFLFSGWLAWLHFFQAQGVSGQAGHFFEVFVGGVGEPQIAFTGSTRIDFSTVFVSTRELSAASQALFAVSGGFPFLVASLGFFGITLLCLRLLKSRPFGRTAQITLGVVGALSVIGAVLVPWGEKKAIILGVEAAGLPTSPEQATSAMRGFVLTQEFDWLWHTNWLWLILGLLLVLVALLWQKATKFQRDQEGLV